MENEGKCWRQDTGTPLDWLPFPVSLELFKASAESWESWVNSGPAYGSDDMANIAQVLNLLR